MPKYPIAIVLLLIFVTMAGGAENIRLRGSLDNCRIRFEKEHIGHVAFMGGSITEMNGYRPMVCKNLRKRFPKTKFDFTDAGIASTCSTTGAMRLKTDVLSKGPVDLFFVEFAVNDDQDAEHARRDCIRGMEGIVRQCRRHNPNMDIIITYFVNPGMRDQLQEGRTPLTIGAHEEVAEHYGISSIHLAREVADQIAAKILTWKIFGGTHPKEPGNRICANMIDELLTTAWRKPQSQTAQVTANLFPAKPIDEYSYGNGRFLDPKEAVVQSGWDYSLPPWKTLPGSKRGRFTEIPMLHADQAGAELVLKFEGQAIGAYVVAGPDAGIVESSIDGEPFAELDLYHRFSKGLHYPRTVLFASDLLTGWHTLRLRVSPKKNANSKGNAARIIQFVAN